MQEWLKQLAAQCPEEDWRQLTDKLDNTEEIEMNENITDKDYPEPHDTCEAGGMGRLLVHSLAGFESAFNETFNAGTTMKHSLQEKLFDPNCPEYYTQKEFEADCADHILPEDLTEVRVTIGRLLWAEDKMRFTSLEFATPQEIAARGSYFENLYADLGKIIARAINSNMEGK